MTDEPEILYHYTTAQGLLGMLSHKALWASNLNYMNDFSELRYSTDIIENEFLKALKESKTVVAKELLKTDLCKPFMPDDEIYNAYGCCFCEKGDELSQWRTYAEKGSGYSIGFSLKRLKKPILSGGSNPRSILKNVVYKPQVQKRLIRSAIKECFKEFETFENDRVNYTKRHGIGPDALFLISFYRKMYPFLFSFKNQAFENEKEWRVVIYSFTDDIIEKLNFREMRGTVVPFVAMRFSPSESDEQTVLPITEIIQGPLGDSELGLYSLRLLLKKHKYNIEAINFRKSEVPIRF